MEQQDTHPDPAGSTCARKHGDALGFLLKHAHLALQDRTDAALSDLRVTSRDLGVLRVIAGGEATSQQDIAVLLGVDRTSMVSLIDALEHAGLVLRRPAPHDRRRNTIALTEQGQQVYGRAEHIASRTANDFLEPLGAVEAARFTDALQHLTHPDLDVPE